MQNGYGKISTKNVDCKSDNAVKLGAAVECTHMASKPLGLN